MQAGKLLTDLRLPYLLGLTGRPLGGARDPGVQLRRFLFRALLLLGVVRVVRTPELRVEAFVVLTFPSFLGF